MQVLYNKGLTRRKNREPAHKMVEKQLHFTSTKPLQKKRKSEADVDNTFKIPTTAQRITLKQIPVDCTNVINIHTKNDHLLIDFPSTFVYFICISTNFCLFYVHFYQLSVIIFICNLFLQTFVNKYIIIGT